MKVETPSTRSVREWVACYKNGEFDSSDVDTQVEAGWFDWFCEDSALAGKTKAMAGAITRIKDGGKVPLDDMSVRFINVKTTDGVLYDEFNLIHLKHMDRGFLCTSGQPLGDGKKWHVYETPNHQEFVAAFSTVTQLAKWLSTPYDAKARWGTFDAPSTATNDELKALAQAQAEEDYGEVFEFDGVMRKTFRTESGAKEWVDYQLENLPPRTVALAIFGNKGSGVYAVNP